MPYISDQKRRKAINEGDTPKTLGELAYAVFRLMVREWEAGYQTYDWAIEIIAQVSICHGGHIGMQVREWRSALILATPIDEDLISEKVWTVIDEAVGEFRRRFLWPLEDEKRAVNGDVY